MIYFILIIFTFGVINGAVAFDNHKVLAPCNVGEIKTVSCNTCFCTNQGDWACTTRQCYRKTLLALRCDPGSVFLKNCNMCICGVNGISDRASCTTKVCD